MYWSCWHHEIQSNSQYAVLPDTPYTVAYTTLTQAKGLVHSQNCSNFPAWQLYEYIIVYCMHLSTQHLGGPVKIFEESAWPTKYRHWPVSSNFEVVPPWLHIINFRSETGSGNLLMNIINTERIRGINDHLKKYFWPCLRTVSGCPDNRPAKSHRLSGCQSVSVTSQIASHRPCWAADRPAVAPTSFPQRLGSTPTPPALAAVP